jgi:hypothetical protein
METDQVPSALMRVAFISFLCHLLFRSRKSRLTTVGTSCADRVTPLYPQKSALTPLTSDGRSVDIVSSFRCYLFFGSRKPILTAVGTRSSDDMTALYQPLTSPTSDGRSVGMVRLRKGHGVCLFSSLLPSSLICDLPRVFSVYVLHIFFCYPLSTARKLKRSNLKPELAHTREYKASGADTLAMT